MTTTRRVTFLGLFYVMFFWIPLFFPFLQQSISPTQIPFQRPLIRFRYSSILRILTLSLIRALNKSPTIFLPKPYQNKFVGFCFKRVYLLLKCREPVNQ